MNTSKPPKTPLEISLADANETIAQFERSLEIQHGPPVVDLGEVYRRISALETKLARRNATAKP